MTGGAFRGRRLALLLVIVAGSAALAAGGEEARLVLRYERAAILGGEAWRFLTGHFVHLGWSHLVLNLAGLILVWALLGTCYSAGAWLAVTGVTLVVISSAFLALEPALGWYVGLSGLLHGWFVAGAVVLATDARPGERRFAAVLLALAFAKVAYEQWLGPLPMTAESAGGPVVVDAHLYGAIGGALAAALVIIWRRTRESL
ncbi:MAG: rhombosortase [Pseudomonadota bacterium]